MRNVKKQRIGATGGFYVNIWKIKTIQEEENYCSKMDYLL